MTVDLLMWTGIIVTIKMRRNTTMLTRATIVNTLINLSDRRVILHMYLVVNLTLTKIMKSKELECLTGPRLALKETFLVSLVGFLILTWKNQKTIMTDTITSGSFSINLKITTLSSQIHPKHKLTSYELLVCLKSLTINHWLNKVSQADHLPFSMKHLLLRLDDLWML